MASVGGFRKKGGRGREGRNVGGVRGGPGAGAWFLGREVLKGGGEDTIPVWGGEKPRRNLEADVTLFCDVLCDTDLQRVFTPDDREQVLAVYGPVHARLLRQALELIADAESARKK
ncbi:phage tail assembly chaperone [Escherichia coli]|uniref:phage tail assembly chaperone n=1 Tax=Escherichia coli TaxID=562 RepID=UPI000B3F1832|nr:phage tail assembly chaperone [Escherichia coli]OVB26564.1 tail assembly protein [Escherichia coli]